ncbi:sodium:proton antiporter NhaD [Microbacter margulisiae]|uniref:Na+/H+ antiporter NhaD/arsenite permease-like protein n=1 Tax=Microbacter margulisiae TaxID=1350067 RepID=A0A7W5H388_9PORP|nr:sodium:proton antiporter NhaD [Microbacter margulisiae]MBB3188241.1 Na+/H+ antiporter NhaD/arsenite permease-like protein [Microbacter margulisiae]
MSSFILILVFIAGYAAIAFEHSIKLNKAASALLTGVACWTLYTVEQSDFSKVNEQLLIHLGDISSILFFLFGAMTIVELIDGHNGFSILSQYIRTTKKSTLLVIISMITFILSALLDNLTTAIVMTSLCGRLLTDKEDRWWFGGMIIIAANAGGAWSPIGDVTTTMLWIGGQVTGYHLVIKLLIPSLVVLLLPLLVVFFKFKGQTIREHALPETSPMERRESTIILALGVATLLFVPFFKAITHLPPFMGMLLALGIMWVATSIIENRKKRKKPHPVVFALHKIDGQSILFFLGILLAVAALQSSGLLARLAIFLEDTFRNDYLIGSALGLISAIIDNVPLVAATQGMYSLQTFPVDHFFWHFIALTTGTGGSTIIIGSAAGVAVMGLEKISFMWYLKKISWLGLLGFLGGILAFVLMHLT